MTMTKEDRPNVPRGVCIPGQKQVNVNSEINAVQTRKIEENQCPMQRIRSWTSKIRRHVQISSQRQLTKRRKETKRVRRIITTDGNTASYLTDDRVHPERKDSAFNEEIETQTIVSVLNNSM